MEILSAILITNYSNYKPKFNGVFSRSNLPRIKDGEYFINLDDKINNISLFFDRSTAIYNLIHLELNIFRKRYKTKSKINQLFRTYLGYKILKVLCADCIVSLS